MPSEHEPLTPSAQQIAQKELEHHHASQAIRQTEYLWPEFRLELVNGQFLVGGSLAGSRWLLKEALIGWGMEAAIAFGPLNHWWEALRLGYEVSCQSADEWLMWAEDLPLLSNDYRHDWWPPLGSRFHREHRWVREHLSQGLFSAVSQAGLGACFGPNYGMQLTGDVFTPDMVMRSVSRLSENACHSCYMEDAADLVIEVVLPEQADIDNQVRRQHYELGGVKDYWVVDPVAQQVQFWQWSPEGYRLQTLDSDGCYRGVPGLIFSPEIFSLDSLQRHLPAFTSSWQQRQWEFQSIEGEELSSDSLPFVPTVGLQPQVISPEHFIAWCPETKLEGGPFPLIGGGEAGTRNAIAMLLMSLGLVEAVKLMPGYEWVRLLRRVERQQQQDAHKRGQWWQQAQLVAQQLHAQYQVGGIGVIGALIHPQPLNYWSNIELVLWDAPEKFDPWRCLRTWPNQLPVNFIEARHATPAQWEDICQRMTVLSGEWRELERRQHQRLQFCWL